MEFCVVHENLIVLGRDYRILLRNCRNLQRKEKRGFLTEIMEAEKKSGTLAFQIVYSVSD